MSGGDYSHDLDLPYLNLSECHVNEALTQLQPIVAKRAFGFFQEKPEICASPCNVLTVQNNGQSEGVKNFQMWV